MSERNILRIYRQWVYPKGKFEQVYRYYTSICQETGRSLNLQGKEDDGEFLKGTVNAILDKDGNVLKQVNQEISFKTYNYTSRLGYLVYGVIIPDKLIHDYGVREDEYIDVTFEKIIRMRGSKKIFPKILRYGSVEIKPKAPLPKEPILPEVLIENEFDDPFYADLVLEINQAYGYGLFRSTLVLLRILFENLLVEMLRSRYGMEKLELFYDKAHGKHHSLSVLLKNVRKNIVDFKPYSDSFNEKFLLKIEKLKPRANASAHVIDEEIRPDFFTTKKDDINYACNLMKSMIVKLKQTKG